MKPNDEVVYTIAISGIKNAVNQKSITDLLPNHTGSAKMHITPATKSAPGAISIPRLFTQWRGDGAEEVWQTNLMDAVKGHGASIAIDVQPWSHAPGYPQGELEL
jgi:hypothetical protein